MVDVLWEVLFIVALIAVSWAISRAWEWWREKKDNRERRDVCRYLYRRYINSLIDYMDYKWKEGR